MHDRFAMALVLALAVAPLSGCIGVANMDELRTRLRGDPETASLGTPTPSPGSPVPVIEVSDRSIRVGETVIFDGSGSRAADGGIDAWSWTIDGKLAAERPTFNWTFEASGLHLVELTVREGNASATEQRQIQVADDRPPIAVVEVERDGQATDRAWVGETVTVSGESSHDPEGRELSHRWRLGDGTNGTGSTIDHAYETPGRYTVVLQVVDAAGQTASADASIAIDDRGSSSGEVTPSDETERVAVPVGAGATAIEVTLDYEADLPLEDLDLGLGGPDGTTRNASDDEGPMPGQRSLSIDVDDPAAGDWTAVIRLDSGDGAGWELTWAVRY